MRNWSSIDSTLSLSVESRAYTTTLCMASSPEWASHRFDNLCRYQGASVHRAPDALRPCRRYSGNFVITGANEPYGLKCRCFRKTEPSLGGAAIVAAVRCHWLRPEAWPVREQAVDRWLQQSARFEDREIRR